MITKPIFLLPISLFTLKIQGRSTGLNKMSSIMKVNSFILNGMQQWCCMIEDIDFTSVLAANLFDDLP